MSFLGPRRAPPVIGEGTLSQTPTSTRDIGAKRVTPARPSHPPLPHVLALVLGLHTCEHPNIAEVELLLMPEQN